MSSLPLSCGLLTAPSMCPARLRRPGAGDHGAVGQAALAELLTSSPGLGDPVGVEHERAARLKPDGVVHQCRTGQHTEQSAGPFDALHRPVGPQDERARMAAARHRELRSMSRLWRRDQPSEHGGAELGVVDLTENGVVRLAETRLGRRRAPRRARTEERIEAGGAAASPTADITSMPPPNDHPPPRTRHRSHRRSRCRPRRPGTARPVRGTAAPAAPGAARVPGAHADQAAGLEQAGVVDGHAARAARSSAKARSSSIDRREPAVAMNVSAPSDRGRRAVRHHRRGRCRRAQRVEVGSVGRG